ncbi:MAG: matrixin family metalloprotease [Minicystis sp.]
MLRLRRLVALALPVLFFAGDAAAFCRTSVCAIEGGNVHGKVCTPAEDDDCGVPLQWRRPCVSFALQETGSRDVKLKDVRATMVKAFSTWMKATCDGGTPSVQVFDFGQVTCDRVEYNQHAGNANIVVFRTLSWPHVDDEANGVTDTIALTTVTYDVEKGDIFDADIEVNEAQNHFTTADTEVDVDLLSVLTHEAGHFLGLAHSPVEGATMAASYDNGTMTLRDLEGDDLAGICTTYPPDRKAAGTCDGLPRHGFSPDCDGLQQEGRCAIVPGPAPDPGPVAPALIALAMVALGRRRALASIRGRSASRARS